MNGYLNSGHDIITTEDIKKNILYLGGPADTKVSVIEIYKNDCHIVHSKIPNIQSFHSIAFTDEAMTFWQYYNIRIGKNFHFLVSSLNLVLMFLKSSSHQKKVALEQKTKEGEKGIKDHSVP